MLEGEPSGDVDHRLAVRAPRIEFEHHLRYTPELAKTLAGHGPTLFAGLSKLVLDEPQRQFVHLFVKYT